MKRITITITAEHYAEAISQAYEAGYKSASSVLAVSSLSVKSERLKNYVLKKCNEAIRRKYGNAHR